MGITIHYHGHIADPKQIPELAWAVQRRCEQLDWPCIPVDERILGTAEILVHHPHAEDENERFTFETYPVDDRWRGIVVSPPECEPLWLTFTREGKLIDYGSTPDSYTHPGHYFARDLLFTKTQFGTPDTHIAVCGLLRLAQRHGVELDVTDEGGYWESGDRQTLEQRLDFLNAAITSLSQAGPETLQETLGGDIDLGDDPKIEVGKRIEQPLPDWRQDWGISAGEN